MSHGVSIECIRTTKGGVLRQEPKTGKSGLKFHQSPVEYKVEGYRQDLKRSLKTPDIWQRGLILRIERSEPLERRIARQRIIELDHDLARAVDALVKFDVQPAGTNHLADDRELGRRGG